jgi:hypothetical protein
MQIKNLVKLLVDLEHPACRGRYRICQVWSAIPFSSVRKQQQQLYTPDVGMSGGAGFYRFPA